MTAIAHNHMEPFRQFEDNTPIRRPSRSGTGEAGPGPVWF